MTAGQFTESSDGGSFSVPISWEKPIFNYSTLVFYTFRYKIGSKNSTEELMVRNCVLKTLRLNKYLLKLAPLYRLLAWKTNAIKRRKKASYTRKITQYHQKIDPDRLVLKPLQIINGAYHFSRKTFTQINARPLHLWFQIVDQRILLALNKGFLLL